MFYLWLKRLSTRVIGSFPAPQVNWWREWTACHPVMGPWWDANVSCRLSPVWFLLLFYSLLCQSVRLYQRTTGFSHTCCYAHFSFCLFEEQRKLFGIDLEIWQKQSNASHKCVFTGTFYRLYNDFSTLFMLSLYFNRIEIKCVWIPFVKQTYEHMKSLLHCWFESIWMEAEWAQYAVVYILHTHSILKQLPALLGSSPSVQARAVTSCPRSCSCPGVKEVHCTFRHLSSIPKTFPKDTERLNLG